jgi:hypothetical protein
LLLPRARVVTATAATIVTTPITVGESEVVLEVEDVVVAVVVVV